MMHSHGYHENFVWTTYDVAYSADEPHAYGNMHPTALQPDSTIQTKLLRNFSVISDHVHFLVRYNTNTIQVLTSFLIFHGPTYRNTSAFAMNELSAALVATYI